MSDGRKNNGGHSTKGKAGRKPKIDEVKLIQKMDAILAPDEVWEALAKKAKEGDKDAVKLWLAYRYGQPKQAIDHTTDGESMNSSPFQVEVVKPDDK